MVRLPAAAAGGAARGRNRTGCSSEAQASPTSGRRILVVDDNRDAAESLAMLLGISGHETHTAHDGAAALEAARALRPDVVLLDIGLPKLNGYEVCRRIREQPWGKEMIAHRAHRLGPGGGPPAIAAKPGSTATWSSRSTMRRSSNSSSHCNRPGRARRRASLTAGSALHARFVPNVSSIPWASAVSNRPEPVRPIRIEQRKDGGIASNAWLRERLDRVLQLVTNEAHQLAAGRFT